MNHIWRLQPASYWWYLRFLPLGPFTLVKPRFLNFAVFCSPFTTCQKNRKLSAGTKLRDFLDRYCACPNISYFSFDWECLQLCVCVCVSNTNVLVCNFDIIVLDWGAYKCVCVCLTRASSLIESNIIVLDWGRCLQLRVCLTFMSSLVSVI